MGRKNVSDIVRGAGYLTSIFDKLDRAVKERGGTDEQLHVLSTDAGDALIGQMADIIVGRPERETYRLTIDCTRALEEYVEAGSYNYANPNLTEENFPSEPEVSEVEAVLVHFNHSISSENAIKELDRQGLRPATMVELAAFGVQYPDEQRQFPIVELGSVWTSPDGDRDVGCLWGNPGYRRFRLYWLGDDWVADCRFLAVRK